MTTRRPRAGLTRIEVPQPPGGRPVTNLQQRREWFRVVNHDGGGVELQIYDEIGMWGVYADEFIAELKGITAPELTLRINSPGGDVFEGVAIYNALLDHPAAVNVIVDGIAASAASFIAQAGDTVAMNRGTQMMIHDASGLCYGDASDMADMLDLLNRVSNEIAGIYAARAGGQVQAWRDLMRAETWMNPAEAVDLGLADTAVPTSRRGSDGQDDGGQDDGGDGTPDNRFSLAAHGYRYAGRDNAPAPGAVDRTASLEAAAEPAGDPPADPVPAGAPDDAPVAESPRPPEPDSTDPPAEPEPGPAGGTEHEPAEPEPEGQPPADAAADPPEIDDWAQAVAACLTEHPSTFEGLLATLRGEHA